MAKRELSNTLRNLKFMQRAVQREEKPKTEEQEQEEEKVVVKEDGQFTSVITQKKKCIVIMEGNPLPGALRGRMSFQSYNPSIDKLNEANDGQPEVPATNSGEGRTSNRENNVSKPDSDSDGEHKRKMAEVVTENPYPNKSPRNQNGRGDGQPASGGSSKGKKQKHRRPDWNVLRPPKAEKRQS